MSLDRHISQLLYRYQCVTVPGFGAFLTETVPANIQESNQTFYPPRKVIFFNANLKNNDGLLANHIALENKIQYDNAVSVIEKEVLLWKILLENKEILTIKDVGEIKTNHEDNLVFIAFNTLNYNTQSFGLSSFVSPAIKREEFKVQTETVETVEPIKLIAQEKTKKGKSYLKYAAVFILSLGAAGFAYKSFLIQTEEAETLLVQAQVQKEIENKIQEATFFIDNPFVAEVTEESKKTYPFHIIASSFRSEKNALKALLELENKGYKARVLEKNKQGLHTVVYGSFATYTEAQYKLTQIQDSINPNAWLLIEEL
jgi:hypothetical protein